jgi:hypothetical protein
MIDDPRRHERKCGAYSESRCLSGARTKHHFRSDPLALHRAAVSKLDPQRTSATVIIALSARDWPAWPTVRPSLAKRAGRPPGENPPILDRRGTATRQAKATQGAEGVARHSRRTRQAPRVEIPDLASRPARTPRSPARISAANARPRPISSSAINSMRGANDISPGRGSGLGRGLPH